MDVRPFVRATTSAVFLFANPNTQARRKIYDNYGTLFPSFGTFEAAYDAITSSAPYTAMVILLKGVRPLHESVFWYRANAGCIPQGWIAGHPGLREACEGRMDLSKAEDMALLSCAGETEA